jgi:hypothetical protein
MVLCVFALVEQLGDVVHFLKSFCWQRRWRSGEGIKYVRYGGRSVHLTEEAMLWRGLKKR